jgi:transposase-like protein
MKRGREKGMDSKLKTLIELVRRLPEGKLDEAIERIQEIKQAGEEEDKLVVPKCPHCGGDTVVKNGHNHDRQQYLCRDCGKSFCGTTNSAVCHSHSGETVWKQVIHDTVNGVAIDKTAGSLGLHHETVFNMRHKILYSLEQNNKNNPIILSGVCEADETYLLESEKGRKIPPDYHRKARKHGAVAGKRGISDEYICVCAGIERDGGAFSMAVNRASPTKDEIMRVFGGKVSSQTLILCDGSKSYDILSREGKCTVINAGPDNSGFNHINTVNGYHSFIKERNRNARGFATAYLNRYNALFSMVYRSSEFIADDIYKMMTNMNGGFASIESTQHSGLLDI